MHLNFYFKWISYYAILSPYDFLAIFEVKNKQDAVKASLISRSLGATFAESWTVIP